MRTMKKSTLSLTVATTLLMALALGCATGTKGLSDAEQIAALLGAWQQGILDQDVDKLMTLHSEDFSHDGYDYEAVGKEALREFVDYSVDEGNFNDVEISFDGADTEIEGDAAGDGGRPPGPSDHPFGHSRRGLAAGQPADHFADGPQGVQLRSQIRIGFQRLLDPARLGLAQLAVQIRRKLFPNSFVL